jgi:hypothetical protein
VVKSMNNYFRELTSIAGQNVASGNINNSRTLRKVAGTEFQKPAFQFSPAFATLGALLPTELTRPAQSVSPQQAAAITAAARALAN